MELGIQAKILNLPSSSLLLRAHLQPTADLGDERGSVLPQDTSGVFWDPEHGRARLQQRIGDAARLEWDQAPTVCTQIPSALCLGFNGKEENSFLWIWLPWSWSHLFNQAARFS